MAHKMDLGEALTQRVQAAVGQAAGGQLHLLQPRQLAQQHEELRSTGASVACQELQGSRQVSKAVQRGCSCRF